jgi:hypothetical protein
LLKHIYGLSDEGVCERWVYDPYFQYFESPLFAVIVCRKFATVAAFSWHLPHHKMPQRLIAGNFEIVARM